MLGLPSCVLTDTYKVSHPFQYPEAKKMVAYGEFRCGYDKNLKDTRIVFTGIRYIVENYLCRRWTMEDVSKSAHFFATHNAGFKPFPFPEDLFLKFIKENDGYFPIKIQSLPEGTCIYPHVPVYVISAEKEYSRLVTYFETILTMVWYPTTVCTLSRRIKDLIEVAFEISVDPENHFLIDSRLHDFGFRGCTSVEQSVIGGCAHLLNFTGSDTLSAAYYSQFHLNNGKPTGNSIPATEHSVMTSFKNEKDAILNMINKFGEGVFACVMDSYDYAKALCDILPSVAAEKVGKGGFMVLRPDSGDPIEVVLMALRAADKVFGSDLNKKGFKVIRGCGVIQGDGINYDSVENILRVTHANGYSAQNVAFGMGAALLQKVNRDTMSFATKLCHVVYEDGTARDVMKKPKTDSGKISLPGEMAVVNEGKDGQFPFLPSVIPRSELNEQQDILQVVYDCGPVAHQWSTFDEIREKIQNTWKHLPKTHDPISKGLKEKIQKNGS